MVPVFVFRSISRNSVNDLLVNGHFEAACNPKRVVDFVTPM